MQSIDTIREAKILSVLGKTEPDFGNVFRNPDAKYIVLGDGLLTFAEIGQKFPITSIYCLERFDVPRDGNLTDVSSEMWARICAWRPEVCTLKTISSLVSSRPDLIIAFRSISSFVAGIILKEFAEMELYGTGMEVHVHKYSSREFPISSQEPSIVLLSNDFAKLEDLLEHVRTIDATVLHTFSIYVIQPSGKQVFLSSLDGSLTHKEFSSLVTHSEFSMHTDTLFSHSETVALTVDKEWSDRLCEVLVPL